MVAHRRALAVAVLVILVTAGVQLLPARGGEVHQGLGVYRGAGAPALVESFGTFAGRGPKYALDYFPAQTWETISNPEWSLRSWAGSPYEVVYSVPLIPDSGGTVVEGATGAYDVHFARLAAVLVAHGEGDAILRLGWEFNGAWFRWSAQGNPEAFAAYWRRIVNAMRAVPGANFRFDWNVSLGTTQFALERAYPGDAYVDVVGADLYDQSWYTEDSGNPVRRWARMLSQTHGLDWFKSFATAHRKPMSFGEWGLSYRSDGYGGGDNPYFIERMYEWISTNNVLYHMYFDFDISSRERYAISTGNFPVAAARYKALFGAGTGLLTITLPRITLPPISLPLLTPEAPPPTTAPTTTPSAPSPTAPSIPPPTQGLSPSTSLPPINPALPPVCLLDQILPGAFTDVAGNVHGRAIYCIAGRGVTQGGPGGLPSDQYGPALEVRRDQMASFLARMIDNVDPSALPPPMPGNRFDCDLGADNPHSNAVHRLAAVGIVRGGPAGLAANCYGPDHVVRRDQMASFLKRAIDHIRSSSVATERDFFGDDDASMHQENINAMAAENVVAGAGGTSFSPTDAVRRDQMASFLARTLDLLEAG